MDELPANHFSRDTSVTSVANGLYQGTVTGAWLIGRGANGGYLTALMLRALEAEVDDPERPPRSLTVHFLRPAGEGNVDVAVSVERAGRSMTTLSARLMQSGKLVALALAAFGTDRSPVESFDDTRFPEVAAPDELSDHVHAADFPLNRRYIERWAIGSPIVKGVPGREIEVGGWIRLADPGPVDHCLLSALADTWEPPVFSRLGQYTPVPTVDLTVHFRAPPPRIDTWCLVRFCSRLLKNGFVEEDGEIWSLDRTLLVQSRQLHTVIEESRYMAKD